MKITIRNGKESEAKQLCKIALAAKKHWNYPDSWYELWGDILEITPEFILNNNVWVATYKKELLGFAGISIKDSIAELEHMWVLPNHMNCGIGKMLINTAVAFCQLHGIYPKRLRIRCN